MVRLGRREKLWPRRDSEGAGEGGRMLVQEGERVLRRAETEGTSAGEATGMKVEAMLAGVAVDMREGEVG
jgi:hypothetical protein